MPVDLNADLGEGAGTDEQLLPLITSANVACGGHAGDAGSMERTVRLAARSQVGIGAHPSYPDRAGFGRRAMEIPPRRLRQALADQVNALVVVARNCGAAVQHVKVHGAIYNLAAGDQALAMLIGEMVREIDQAMIVVAPAGSAMADVLERAGLRVAREAFIDRGYTSAGALVPRDEPGALIVDPGEAAARAVQLARRREVLAVDGTRLPMAADTLCIHGDTPGAVDLALEVRRALRDSEVMVASMGTFL